LHSNSALSKRKRPCGSTRVRPASLATSLLYGQYAAADGRVTVAVVAAFAGDELDDCADGEDVDDVVRSPPQPARSATSTSAAETEIPNRVRTAAQVT
jgi:hypothetical protein